MKRREFIAGLGSAAAWPAVARAQQGEQVRRIGVLEGVVENGPIGRPRRAAFLQGLERLGWSEGRNIRIDWRYAAGIADRYESLAQQLLALQPELIIATTTPAAAALQREGTTLPIVFIGVSDPIGSGFVASLNRPGGNLTGLLNIEATIAGKWIALLKEIAPRLERVAFMANPKTTRYDYFLPAAEAAARTLAIELVPARVETPGDIEHAIEIIGRAPNGAIALPPDTFTFALHERIIALATKHRLPGVYWQRGWVADGGLMSYGIDPVDQMREVTPYVDRVLRGEKPADLPVQAPTRYETVLNMKTAKALGLTIPETLLATADEVIE
jgi:putative tryptophan/tyrosine transport system substrate-binding protein